jgi:PKHD-type hydroxylase
MQNLYHVFPCAVPVTRCNEIIRRGVQLPRQNASIGFDNDHIDNSYRVSTISWFSPRENKDIVDLLMSYADEANRDSFGFDIYRGLNDIQFTEYQGTNKGRYEWHHDVWWTNPKPHDRKLSIVIQLSPPESYVGGEFEFSIAGADLTKMQDFKMQGSVLVFPSFFNHRVTQLTAGTRYSLVSWIEGPKFR